MFRGKESLNRIELSRLVQDLLNFAVLGLPAALGEGQVGGGVSGASGGMGGCPPTHAHAHTCMRMHAHAHTHMYTCIEIANGRRHGGIHV